MIVLIMQNYCLTKLPTVELLHQSQPKFQSIVETSSVGFSIYTLAVCKHYQLI